MSRHECCGHGRQDSNLQPAVLETAALPIELRPCVRRWFLLHDSYAKNGVASHEPPIGFEPMTPSLPWKCSTTELRRPKPACACWSGRRDSNPRPSAWKADALPSELLPLRYVIRYSGREGAPTGAPSHKAVEGKRVWAGEDSNLRTLREQIYSLPPLTTRQPARYCRRTRSEKVLSKTPVRMKSWRRDSNPQPAHYK